MKKTTLFFSIVIVLFALLSQSCSTDDVIQAASDDFDCDSYWISLDLNRICDVNYPEDFNFDTLGTQESQCGAISQSNGFITHVHTVLITKTKHPAAADAIYKQVKSTMEDAEVQFESFSSSADQSLKGKQQDEEVTAYIATKGQYVIQFNAAIAPSLSPCYTEANNDEYMREFLNKLTD